MSNRIYIRLIVILGIAGMLFIFQGCKNKTFNAKWTNEEISADGNRDEWENIGYSYFEDEDIALGISNSDKYLNIFFSFKKPIYALSIKQKGITIWVNEADKEKKTSGLRFTGGPSIDISKAMHGRELPPMMDPNRIQERIKERPDIFQVVDEKGNTLKAIGTDGVDGPEIGYARTKDGIYTFEFKIPLTEISLEKYGIPAMPGDNVAIGFEWGEIDMPDRDEIHNRMAGRGGLRGGFGGGGQRMSRPQMERPEKKLIWLSTGLAVKF